MGRDLHVHTHPSSVEHWRHLIEIVALLIAAVWGFYVFVYQERIKPESEPPKLLTTSEVNHWPLTANNELVKTAITLKNNGDVPLRLGFFAVNIYGNKYQTSPPTHLWSGENRQFRFAASTQRLARRKMLGSVLFKRRWFGGEGEGDLNPTQAVTFYPPMVVKRGEYDPRNRRMDYLFPARFKRYHDEGSGRLSLRRCGGSGSHAQIHRSKDRRSM